MQKEKPILFSGEMVRAILDGRKTQTRRVVKLPPGFAWELFMDDGDGEPHFHRRTGEYSILRDVHDASGVHDVHVPHVVEHIPANPYGVPGDRLWVRETWARGFGFDGTTLYCYRADHSEEIAKAEKWKPSIHMPYHASRLTLETTDVRVERLCEITDADARAEGFASSNAFIAGKFASALDPNTWVWVISFKRLVTDL